MDRNEIITRIYQMLTEKFMGSVNKTDHHGAQPIITETLYMNAITLTYLFFEIKKRFDIEIYVEDLTDYSFLTMENICNLIISQKNQVNK